MNQFIEKLSRLVVDVIGISRRLGDESRRLSELSGKSMESMELVNDAAGEIVSLSESNAAAVEQTSWGSQRCRRHPSQSQRRRGSAWNPREDDRGLRSVARKL
jgi:hypothetical protein